MNTSTSHLFSFLSSIFHSCGCLPVSLFSYSLSPILSFSPSFHSFFVWFFSIYSSVSLLYHLLHTQHKQTRKTITSFKRQKKHYQQMSLIILLYVKYVNIPGDGCFETTQNNLNGKESHSYQIIAKHHFLNISQFRQS